MQNTAPVYSLDDQRARAESAAWSRLTSAADAAELYAAWLALTASRIERTRSALLLTRQEAGSYGVAAAWPDPRRDLQYLGPIAQQVLERREGVVAGPEGGTPGADGAAHVGYPLVLDGDLCGAVVFDVSAGGGVASLQMALREVHWASAWLLDHFRRELLARREVELRRSTLLNEVLATAMQHPQLKTSALAAVNDLAARLTCDRVSVGFEKGGHVEPLALSHTATFDPRSDLVRWIADAMEESLDLGVPVAFPAPDDDDLGALAHAESARRLGVVAMLSVPVRDHGQTVGVMTLERTAGPPFDDRERALAEALGNMLGPVWALQRANERGLPGRLRDRMRSVLHELAGPRHPGLKFGAALLGVLLVVAALWQTDHRVAARTVVEGSTQLSVVAPFEGFVAEAFARAGETVRQGQPLARLDDRDLRLERERWLAERQQLDQRWQQAQAAGDRAAMGVIAAQRSQVEAQLALSEERLGRATITAPFDGVVVSGDLSQQVGSPVPTGKLLFEVAPLAGYRVMMEVDDRDIARIALDQAGELVLSGMPDRKMALTVRRITPVSVQKDGRNVFTVEAAVQSAGDRQLPAGLRPGMEGVAKIVVGERSLLWIWTHRFVDWLRLWTWSWLP